MPRSFGAFNKSTFNSTAGGQVSVDNKITLPEGSYFTSRRAADDFDRTLNDSNLMDEYFGFDDDDDNDNNNDNTLVEQSKSMAPPKGLDEIRAKLKRFLHNPDAVAADSTIKKSKTTGGSAKKRALRTPIKSPVKRSNRTPIKRNIVFADTAAKQKDIRSAFTAKTTQQKTGDESITLFEEVVPVSKDCDAFLVCYLISCCKFNLKFQNQDRRRSYSRPQRQRKRRISIDSEHSEDEEEEEQHSDDDEDMDAGGKPKKRAKRRKKMNLEHNAKVRNLTFSRKYFYIDDFELFSIYQGTRRIGRLCSGAQCSFR